MSDKNKVLQSIFAVVDEVNDQLPDDQKLEKAPDTVLFGESGKLDSLGLVNMVVATEQRIREDFGKAVSITDERAMSQRNSPFRTIDTLADYIATILNEDGSGHE